MIRKFMLCLVFFLIAFGSFYSVIRSLNIIIRPEIRDATLAELDGDEAFEARYSIWDGYDNTQVHDDLFRQTDFYADILSARYTAIPIGDAYDVIDKTDMMKSITVDIEPVRAYSDPQPVFFLSSITFTQQEYEITYMIAEYYNRYDAVIGPDFPSDTTTDAFVPAVGNRKQNPALYAVYYVSGPISDCEWGKNVFGLRSSVMSSLKYNYEDAKGEFALLGLLLALLAALLIYWDRKGRDALRKKIAAAKTKNKTQNNQ